MTPLLLLLALGLTLNAFGTIFRADSPVLSAWTLSIALALGVATTGTLLGFLLTSVPTLG